MAVGALALAAVFVAATVGVDFGFNGRRQPPSSQVQCPSAMLGARPDRPCATGEVLESMRVQLGVCELLAAVGLLPLATGPRPGPLQHCAFHKAAQRAGSRARQAACVWQHGMLASTAMLLHASKD